jgi:hypothetical protein
MILEYEGRRYENATVESLLDAGIPPEVVAAAELAEAQRSAFSRIDAEATTARARHVTVIPGQELTYQRKADQAREYLALVPDARGAATFPLLIGEAAALGVDPAVHAGLILGRDAGWAMTEAAIEVARVSGKAAVRAAGDVESVLAARDAAVAALAAA